MINLLSCLLLGSSLVDVTVHLHTERGIVSGTVIGSDTILTCAHGWTEDGGSALVEWFDKFGRITHTAQGQVIKRHVPSDLALVRIPEGNHTTVKVTEDCASILQDVSAWFVGADHGKPPSIKGTKTLHRSKVFSEILGDTITVDSSPRQGNSGGGLFDEKGELIGVCSAADYEGYFASARAIHKFLGTPCHT